MCLHCAEFVNSSRRTGADRASAYQGGDRKKVRGWLDRIVIGGEGDARDPPLTLTFMKESEAGLLAAVQVSAERTPIALAPSLQKRLVRMNKKYLLRQRCRWVIDLRAR
jgi:hypothetical protein